MVKVKEVIVVEGNYDKIKLASFIDGIIFVTGGFSLMSDEDRIRTLITLAEKCGVVILTDSDSAGFRIRNFLKQKLPESIEIRHAYIPEIKGKERRKREAGAEGILGVEGMDAEVIINALKSAGCELGGASDECTWTVTKAYLYSMGLSGGANSAQLRRALCERLGLPSKLSANMLCAAIGRMVTKEELERMISQINVF